MNTGQALEDATCLQVLQIMRRMSGLDLDSVATGMDRNRQTVGCWFGEGSPDKFIPLPLVPKFCHVLGSSLLLEWLVAQYERLRRDEVPHAWSGAVEPTLSLLVRGVVQSGNALALLHDMGNPLTPSQGRQVSEAALLAVATLAAAAREARGAFPGPPKSLRYFRANEQMVVDAPQLPRWRRLTVWLSKFWRWGQDREVHTQSLQTLRSDLQTYASTARRQQDALAEAKRIIGAMGFKLRELREAMMPEQWQTVRSILDQGQAFGLKVEREG